MIKSVMTREGALKEDAKVLKDFATVFSPTIDALNSYLSSNRSRGRTMPFNLTTVRVSHAPVDYINVVALY